MTLREEDVSRLAATAARRYARKCWWSDREDLQQVAELAALEALRRYDARVGAAPEQYVWRAIVLAVARQLWLDSTPATGGTKHRPGASSRGLFRSPLSAPTDDTEDDWSASAHEAKLSAAAERVGLGSGSATPPDDLYEDARWLARVRARLHEVAAEVVASPGAANTLRVLSGEASAKDVADVRGTTVGRVHRESFALRAALGADAVLYDLIRQKREG